MPPTMIESQEALLARLNDKLDVAMKALTTGDLTTVSPEQADRYIRRLIDKSVILSESRRLPFGKSDTRKIDFVGFNARIMQAASEGTAEIGLAVLAATFSINFR